MASEQALCRSERLWCVIRQVGACLADRVAAAEVSLLSNLVCAAGGMSGLYRPAACDALSSVRSMSIDQS